MGRRDDNDEFKVTVSKDDLLSTLQANRDEHEKEFTEADAAYRKVVAKELQRRLLLVESGAEFDLFFRDLVQPKSHVDDFDTAIEMLEWHRQSDITLSREEFKKYVRNEWDWLENFKALHAGYTTAAS